MSLPPPIPLAEAQERLLAMAQPLGPEHVPLPQALGRFLAGDLVARRQQPAADMSAMDGYAVHDPAEQAWQVIGESAAGRPFGGIVGAGQAVRISTGALLPNGAAAVLLQEEALRDGDRLALSPGGEASPRHIRRRGFDFVAGDRLLPPGARFGPAQLALAISAGLGAGTVAVGRRPRVAVIDSGDELAAAEAASWADHQLPASNGAMIAALVAPLAESVERIGPVADRMEALAEALARAASADVIVTTGGASVGDHDLVRPALEAWGARIDFWRVAMKPGKPLLVARRGETVVIGLPGNPVSSYVTACFMLLPLLRRLAGGSECLPRPTLAKLASGLPAVGNRLEFVRARMERGEAVPLTEQDSSALRALAGAHALIERPIGAPAAAPGAIVPVYSLEGGGMA